MEVERREGWRRREEEEGENIFHPGGANQSRRVILAELIILVCTSLLHSRTIEMNSQTQFDTILEIFHLSLERS